MEKESSPSVKPRFSEVCQRYHLDYQAMQAIAEKASVPKKVVDAMSVSSAVHRGRAESVLAALSEYTHDTWTLENVHVAVLPTFQDFHTFYQFDLAILSTASGIPFDTVDRMLRGEPITLYQARRIMQAASQQSRLCYRFYNVDVKLSDAEEDYDEW